MNQYLKYGIKYVLKPIGGFIEFILAFGMIYWLISIFGAIIPVGGDEPEDPYPILVRTNGVHTDIIFESRTELYNWTEFIPPEHFPYNETHNYIAIGWGDKGFFLDTPTWADLTFSTAFKAAFTPSATAMHVQYFDDKPSTHGRCKLVYMDRSKHDELVEFVTSTFKMKNGEVELIPDRGYWKDDNFYEANGNYHLFNTCNRWTNVALKEAGVKTGLFALFSDGIMDHL